MRSIEGGMFHQSAAANIVSKCVASDGMPRANASDLSYTNVFANIFFTLPMMHQDMQL